MLYRCLKDELRLIIELSAVVLGYYLMEVLLTDNLIDKVVFVSFRNSLECLFRGFIAVHWGFFRRLALNPVPIFVRYGARLIHLGNYRTIIVLKILVVVTTFY